MVESILFSMLFYNVDFFRKVLKTYLIDLRYNTWIAFITVRNSILILFIWTN